MKGIGRNLRFWGVALHKVMLSMVATIAVMLVFFTLMEGGNFMEEYGKQVPFYLIMLAFISSFMNALNGMNTQFPLTLSFGSTRKDSFIAMQVMQHLIMAEYLIAFYAWVYFVILERKAAFGEPYFMSAMGIVLLVLGLCHLTSAVSLRFGRTIGVIVYIVSIIAVISVTAGIIIHCSNAESFVGIESLGTVLNNPWIFLAGALFDGVMIAVLYAQVRKSNLQFA